MGVGTDICFEYIAFSGKKDYFEGTLSNPYNKNFEWKEIPSFTWGNNNKKAYRGW